MTAFCYKAIDAPLGSFKNEQLAESSKLKYYNGKI